MFGAVARHVHAHVPHAVLVYADPEGHRLAAVGFLELLEKPGKPLFDVPFVSHACEVVLADSPRCSRPEMLRQDIGRVADELVAFFEPVLLVVVLHADEVEVQHDGAFALVENALAL